MKLRDVTVELFRNFVQPQTVQIEDDVTCLVGKNESGKTALLLALHRLKPANGTPAQKQFDVTLDYPRWRLARDRATAPSVAPIRATFELSEAERTEVGKHVGGAPPEGTFCLATRDYANKATVSLRIELADLLRLVANDAAVDPDDREPLLTAASLPAVQDLAKSQARDLKEANPLRAKALAAFAASLGKYEYLVSGGLSQEATDVVWAMVPETFYFSSYDLLPGEADLTELAEKVAAGTALGRQERTVLALLRHAGEDPQDFLDENYASRKAELQAASSDLTQHVFKYWRQNTDLEVVFDDDLVNVGPAAPGVPIMHRLLKIEIRDARHGGVETNFATRSTGFQWFFSFFAAFSEYQARGKPLIVLLDEPGTSLHGDAQRDFVRYVFNELGASKQTIYTTHSQHMVDPTKYEKLRAVHDRATRENPNQGVAVTRIDLSADRGTILPVESALGYSVSQHLFLGSGPHLAVEGSSDFVYLLRMSEHLAATNGTPLDPRFSVIPVGGADNMPAFVALMGRRLQVTALIDGAATSKKTARVRAAAENNGLSADTVVPCGAIAADLPSNADIEDLFAVDDYLRLYNLAFGTNLSPADLPQTSEPVLRRLEAVVGSFDHAVPAHALTAHRSEFFPNVSPATGQRFAALFDRLNSTISG